MRVSWPSLNFFDLQPVAGRLALVFLVATSLMFLSGQSASAKYASFVIDADTGAVLHEVNADTRNYPASLTKMMTLYMVFDALERGQLSLQDSIKFSARAARQPASKLGLKRGESITVEQAILAIVTKSANDVASAVSEKLSGSERNFALKMTAQARKLGMSRTIFRNASGLPHRGQQSTARDMSKLALRLRADFPQFYHYFSTAQFSFHGKKHRNHNKLLKSYQGTDGIKTGYIRASGFNLVASVERDGRRVIGVVFGSRSSRSRNAHMTKLLNKGFAKIDTALAGSQYTGTTHKKSVSAKPNKKPRPDQIATLKVEWGIQVGAYKTTKPARSIAQKAINKAPDLLMDGYIKIVPLTKGVRTRVFRARILGLSKKQAYRACRVLKADKINCMELRVKKGLRQIADAS